MKTAVLSTNGVYRYRLGRSWGNGLRLGYAYRATNPRDLVDAAGAGVSPAGPANAETIEQVIIECPKVVAAWGSTFADSRGTFLLPRLNVEAVAGRCGRSPLWCLGLTKTGHPRHPLYVRADAQLQVWR